MSEWDNGGFGAIADLVEAAAWSEGFRRGLAFARAEQEAAWPESWRAALRIMREPGGRLILSEADARRFVEAGGDVSKVHVSPLCASGTAYAIDTQARGWIYDPLRVPGSP